jgi:hypothetical protein
LHTSDYNPVKGGRLMAVPQLIPDVPDFRFFLQQRLTETEIL